MEQIQHMDPRPNVGMVLSETMLVYKVGDHNWGSLFDSYYTKV